MRFQVFVTNQPMQDFTVLESAIDYAARHVYLPPHKGKLAHTTLGDGKPYTYEYGFNHVAIVPVTENTDTSQEKL